MGHQLKNLSGLRYLKDAVENDGKEEVWLFPVILELEEVACDFYEGLELRVLLIIEVGIQKLKHSLAVLSLMKDYKKLFDAWHELKSQREVITFLLK